MESFTSNFSQDHHCPTPDDVFAVRSFLLAFVPAELANLILNEANYWPKATLSFERENPLSILASTRSESGNAHACCLVTPKLCDLLSRGDSGEAEPYEIKSVCFKIVSHDQGRCSSSFPGPYEGSHTWFEAIIVRDFMIRMLTLHPGVRDFMIRILTLQPGLNYADLDTFRIHHELDAIYPNPKVVTVKTPDDENSDTWNIQRNERANKAFQLHTVVWTEEEEEVDDESIFMNETGRGLGRGFVRSLMKEDRIAVMARAQYPGWINYIKSVELEIYYSV